jgi:hypothetical protein
MSDNPVSREEFDRLDHDVNGNGQAGLRQKLDLCVSQLDAIRGGQDARRDVDQRRWAVQTIIIAALTLAVGIMALLDAHHQVKTGELSWPHSPHKTLYVDPDPVVASKQIPPEDAGGPAIHY